MSETVDNSRQCQKHNYKYVYGKRISFKHVCTYQFNAGVNITSDKTKTVKNVVFTHSVLECFHEQDSFRY